MPKTISMHDIQQLRDRLARADASVVRASTSRALTEAEIDRAKKELKSLGFAPTFPTVEDQLSELYDELESDIRELEERVSKASLVT